MKAPRQPIICECGDHAFVPLTKGFVTLASPEDIDLLGTRCWHAATYKDGTIRAKALGGRGGKPKYLSREIMRPPEGMVVDHINRDPTDNRRENLRVCTELQNRFNSIRKRKYDLPKGVRLKKGGSFEAWIKLGGNARYLGSFKTPEDASAAYASAARELFGEFARAA